MCSAAETTVDSGAFATMIPRRVAASTSTLSTPDARAADHLQPLGALDQVGGQLRRRADDDRVVAADDLLERRSRRRRRRRSASGAARRPPLRRSPRGRGRVGGSAAPSAAGDAAARTPRAPRSRRLPRSTSAPRSASTSSTAAICVVMSKTSNQPMWPRRKIFPFSSPWPFAIVIPKRSRTPRDDVAGVDARRRADRGHDGAPVLVRREELEPERLDARARRPAEPDVAVERGLEPLLEQQPERDVEPGHERDRRRERRVELLLRLRASAPSRSRSAARSRSRRARPRRRRRGRAPAAT